MLVDPDRRARICQLRPTVRRDKRRRIVAPFLHNLNAHGRGLDCKLPIVF